MLIGHDLIHEAVPMVQVFYPNDDYKPVDVIGQGLTVLSGLSDGIVRCELYNEGKLEAKSAIPLESNDPKELARLIKATIYGALSGYTGKESPWGLLTGIRPAKLMRQKLDEGLSESEINEYFSRYFLMSSEKIRLALSVAKSERDILAHINLDKPSLYLGIPFCPTRCVYCSFGSAVYKRYEKSIEPYLDALLTEIDFVADRISSFETIYIGGGTPTSLNTEQLKRLLDHFTRKFPTGDVKEFSVEAGRPDTITREKLRILRDFGVTRISINPQTMNEKTLPVIGRSHTVSQFLESYQLARQEGFDNINVDLIVGLPGEDINDVEHTFNELKRLKPGSVTVHTLSVKRASPLMEHLRGLGRDKMEIQLPDTKTVESMLNHSRSACDDMGLLPYYMYRQKNMLGNFENVGYAKPGFEGLYNVLIMEEVSPVIALGAGSVSKLVFPNGRIERVFNYKTVEDYIGKHDEILRRKAEVL